MLYIIFFGFLCFEYSISLIFYIMLSMFYVLYTVVYTFYVPWSMFYVRCSTFYVLYSRIGSGTRQCGSSLYLLAPPWHQLPSQDCAIMPHSECLIVSMIFYLRCHHDFSNDCQYDCKGLQGLPL